MLGASMGIMGATKLVRVHAKIAGDSWIDLLSTIQREDGQGSNEHGNSQSDHCWGSLKE